MYYRCRDKSVYNLSVAVNAEQNRLEFYRQLYKLIFTQIFTQKTALKQRIIEVELIVLFLKPILFIPEKCKTENTYDKKTYN